jgi:hypothetical protein
VAAARKASRYFRSVICLRSTRPRSQIATIYAMLSLFTPPRSVTSFFFRAGGSPKVPATVPPVCILFADAFQRLLTAHRKPGLCVVVLPAVDAFQRPSSQRLLHYWSPSSFHLLPVCWQLQRAYYLDFARVRAPRSVPSSFVQRTGCSACGLGYPHQILVVAHLLGGRGCASRKALPLCLPLITCRFYEKVRTAHLSRIGRSAKTNFPLTDSAFCVRAAEATSPQDEPPHFGPADVFMGIICGWKRHMDRRSLEPNGFG